VAEVLRYVNTAAAAGGDGTTPNATDSGDGTRAYSTLSEWESNEGTNLVTDGDTHRVVCTGGADSTYVVLNGFTTGSSNTCTIEGEWDPATCRFDSTKYNVARTTANQIDIQQSWTIFDKMQFDGSGTANHGPFIQGAVAESDITYKNSVFYDFARTGAWQRLNATNTKYENNLFYNLGWGCVGTDGTSTNRGTLYNCTGYDYNTANNAGGSFTHQNANGQWKVVNCIGIASSSSTRGDFEAVYTLATGSDYNASSDTTAPGANSIHSITDSTEFKSVTGGSENFHLSAGSTLRGDGVGPSSDSDVPTTDVDGDTRSGTTCDIGFDEYVAVGGGLSIPIAMYHYRHHHR